MVHERNDTSVGVLGPVVVAGPDGQARTPRGERAAALLVTLALAEGRTVPVSTLVDELWTDGVPADPRAALQSLVSRLRATAGDAVVVARHGGYALDVDSDLARAAAGLTEARAALAHGEAAGAADAATHALALWRSEPGEALGPAYGDLARALARTAGTVRDELMDVRRHAAVALGDHETVVTLAAEAFDVDPTDEVAARDLIGSLGALGRQNEAGRVFARLRHALVTELGTDPSPEVAALVPASDAGAAAHRGRVTTEPAGGIPEPVGVASAVPAPARATARGLRAAAQPLLGREDDVARLLAALDEERLVTILGPGGLGKTRLAQEVAHRAFERADRTTPLQVVVAELAGVRTDDDVVLGLADAFGIAANPTARLAERLAGGDIRDQLVETVRAAPTLLVLDNCEHVVAGAAAWAADLLGASSTLRLLTTSRAPLQLADEQVYALTPLAADGAGAELFRRRAVAARPGVRLPDDVVARLVDKLDGLPLAIELAAARVRTLSIEEIESHLGERFALLRGGDRTAPARHQTLEAVIEWSWNLLAPAQQRLWQRVAVLPDGFTAQAAAVLGRDDPGARPLDVLDDLEALVTQSIVSAVDAPGGTRYRMLETVREFGLARLAAAGEDDAVHVALWAWAAEVADRCSTALLGPGQVDALEEIVREHENLLFALRAAGAPAPGARATGQSVVRRPDAVVRLFVAITAAWAIRGADERVTRLAPVVAVAATWWDVPREHRGVAARAYLVAAMARPGDGQRAAGLTAMVRLLARTRRLLRADALDPAGPAIGPRTTTLAGLALMFAQGRDADASQAAEVLRGSDDPVLAFIALVAASQSAENEGRLTDGLTLAEQAYDVAAAIGDPASRAFAATLVATGRGQVGDAAGAVPWSRRARDGFDSIGADVVQGTLDMVDLAAALEGGDLAAAERLCAGMERAAADASSPPRGVEQRAMAAAARAEVAFAQGDAAGSVAAYRRALDVLRDPEGPAAPWAVLLGSACAVRMVEAGQGVAAVAVARDAARQTAAYAAAGGHRAVDRPVLGTACVAVGAVLALSDGAGLVAGEGAALAESDGGALAGPGETAAGAGDRGVELLCLGDALGARQDFPALRRRPLLAAAAARHGTTALEAAGTKVASIPRDELPRRALDLLRTFAGPVPS